MCSCFPSACQAGQRVLVHAGAGGNSQRPFLWSPSPLHSVCSLWFPSKIRFFEAHQFMSRWSRVLHKYRALPSLGIDPCVHVSRGQRTCELSIPAIWHLTTRMLFQKRHPATNRAQEFTTLANTQLLGFLGASHKQSCMLRFRW